VSNEQLLWQTANQQNFLAERRTVVGKKYQAGNSPFSNVSMDACFLQRFCATTISACLLACCPFTSAPIEISCGSSTAINSNSTAVKRYGRKSSELHGVVTSKALISSPSISPLFSGYRRVTARRLPCSLLRRPTSQFISSFHFQALV
jgi:hypothetical protein